jgi:hypothetical protein
MSDGKRVPLNAVAIAAAMVGLAFAGTGADAQVAPSGSAAPAANAISGGGPGDPNPYYIGVSQALTHDSNVYRIPSGVSDNYSTTSLLGGFDQAIGRQRLFGRANVSANRYQHEDSLNNVGYGLAAGVDWETIEHLSGGLNASLNRSLAAPVAGAGTPVATRNLAETRNIEARARWGGVSLLTLEGGVDYSSVDYSAPAYVSSESSRYGANLNLFYRPGGPLRVGVGVRGDRTRTPKAFLDPVTGQYQATRLNAEHLDLLADYDLTGSMAANGRLSYTRQTNSGAGDADFSGITGNVGLTWQATGKITLRADAARDAGFNAQTYNSFAFTPTSTGIALTPVVGLYENNQITTSAGLGLSYAATAKINATASARYQRARLTNVNAPTASPDVIDVSKIASLGANYEITRNWGAACNLSHERRSVSGGVGFSYTASSVGCSTQFTWR